MIRKLDGERAVGKAGLLALGFLSALADVALGSLSSGFIDQVLTEGDKERALPILCSYLVFSVAGLWLNYDYLKLIQAHSAVMGKHREKLFTFWIRVFTILLNGAFVMPLHPLILVSCGILLGIVTPWLCWKGRKLSPEGAGAMQSVFQAGMLLVGGNFVMRSSITMGQLYAVSLFSGKIVSQFFAIFIRFPSPPQQPECRSFSASALARKILSERLTLASVVLLSLMNMACESISLTLQRISLRDCIPNGDWENLVYNCLLLCGAALISLLVRKGGAQGLRQLFHGYVPGQIECRLDLCARQMVTAILGIYFAAQLPKYNHLLAEQATVICLLVLLACLLTAMSHAWRCRWGNYMERLYDLVFGGMQNFLTLYMYLALTWAVTQISVGDLVLFMTAFRGLCSSVRDWSKLVWCVASVDVGPAAQTTPQGLSEK